MFNHKFLQNTNVRSACVSSPSSPVPDDVLRGATRSPHTGSPGLPPVSWCVCSSSPSWISQIVAVTGYWFGCSSLLSDHHWGLDRGAGTYIEAVMSQRPVGFRPAFVTSLRPLWHLWDIRGGTWCWFVVAGNWIFFYCNLQNRPFNNSNGNHWNMNITLIQIVDKNTLVFTKSPF